MYCMKCGREIEEGQVFCHDCLAVMAKYPVKPGTVIQLPVRRESSVIRRQLPRRKTLTPEEQIRKLRRTLRVILIGWLITLLLLSASLYPAICYILEEEHFLPGQNYSLIDSLRPTEE